jgi:hypothetical protein
MKLTAAIPVLAAACLVSAADAQHVNRPPTRPAAQRPQRPDRPQKQEKAQAQEKDAIEGGPASPKNLEKLAKLSPAERNKALSSLPPGRRAQIEQKLNQYQKMPPQQRAKVLDQFQRLQTLPPQKQAQVRASLRSFATLPEPRHQLIQKQISQMKGLSDSDRRSLMNSEEFRSKFTPAEQQMIEDISLVAPQELITRK